MGFTKENGQEKEETDSTEKKVCPNCRKRLKKNWLGFFLLLCLLAACAAGAYYYITVYSVTKSVLGDIEVVQSEEAVQEAEDIRRPEEKPMTENEPVQIENLPEIATAVEGPADSESEETGGLLAGIVIEEESGESFVTEKEDELEGESELAQNDDEDVTGRSEKSGDEEEENEHAGMMADAGMADETDVEPEPGTDSVDDAAEITDISMYTEEEFRDMCRQVDYKKLLRSQELYLNAAVTEELTVVEQVDGGLFDENIYYLCKKEDERGITRYYIIRDDREEDGMPILEGDVLRVYGQLFGSCKLPGYLVKTQPVVPALTMVYYDLLEE